MPLYEYKCDRCKKTFEVIQKFSDAPIEVHEECGGQVERLISAPALQFKGTGWYVTDYAGNGKGGSVNHDGKAEKKSDAKPDSKTEAKSEPKAAESKTESKPASTTTADK